MERPMTSSPGDRRARRQAARAEARRAEERRSSAPRWLLPGLIAVAVVVAAVLAFVLPGAGGPGSGGSSTLPPSASAGASGATAAADVPVITGTALPPFQGVENDPAVGQPAPEVTGADFDGEPVSITADGRPKVVVFLAHWCPHCQDEVPLIQAWVGAGGLPDGVDLVSVATGTDPGAPNYPPDAWLEREGWTVPVIVDPTNTVAAAYGLASYPFWVFIGPDGNVRARAAGELPMTDLEATIRALTAG
jgi:cytochrome c biogenesis protein CcmG, thiol:disulfide interchange protein DsbE